MNTIDLLDKLDFPLKLGLEGENALVSKQTLMDAYLSAASLQFNRQLFGLDTNQTLLSDLNLNRVSAELPVLSSNFDLFKRFTPEIESSINSKDLLDTKVILDLNKFDSMQMSKSNEPKVNISHEGSSQPDTELDSYTKIEEKATPKPAPRRGKRKVDKTNIGEFIADERRRLMRKLESCEEDRVVFRRRVKNSKKDPKVSAENYRGSRYWGVSKNKSKWQVISCSYSFHNAYIR